MNDEKKRLLILLLASLVVIGGTAYVFYQEPPKKVSTVEERNSEEKRDRIRVNLQIKGLDKEKTLTTKIEEGSTMFELMELFRKNESLTYDMTNYTTGEVVDSINDLTNNKATGERWVLYLEAEELKEDIKEIVLKEGSTYVWSYEK